MFPHFVLFKIPSLFIEYVNRTVIETKSKIFSNLFLRRRIRSDVSLSNKIIRTQGYGNGTGNIFTFIDYVTATRKRLYLNFTSRGRSRAGESLTKKSIRFLWYGNGTVNETKVSFKKKFYFRFKIGDAMSTPAIQDDEAARLAEEAAAAVRAAQDDRNRRPGSGPPAPPATGGVVQTDTALPPATERSKIIRINRQLKSSALILGDAGGETSLSSLENFHSLNDGRTHRSVLVENMADFSITTASFRPDTWRCISCSAPHPILPKKRNFEQWGGGRAVIILSDQAMPALIPTENKTCPAILRVEGGGSARDLQSFLPNS
jgi:hypothetical protein